MSLRTIHAVDIFSFDVRCACMSQHVPQNWIVCEKFVKLGYCYMEKPLCS